MEAVILFTILIITIAMSIPIGITLGLATGIAMWLTSDIPLIMLAQKSVTGLDSFPLLAIPFFILAGSLMCNGGISRRLVNLAESLVGFITGGLAMVTVLACMFFAAISGSGPATVSAIGSFMVPSMKERKYDASFAAAITAAATGLPAVKTCPPAARWGADNMAEPNMTDTPATARAAEPLIDIRDLIKTYYIGRPNELEILHGINLTVWPGEFVAIVGESGSGKSTVMNIIGALDRPTKGSYLLDGIDVQNATDRELSAIRNRKIGFVFQTFNLIGRTTALKNVELPMLYAGVPARERSRRAKELLAMVGMGDRARHQPNELSGGQKQRVAIARAMACNPALLLADEPTGALDSQTSRNVMDLFHDLHEQSGKTIVLITHNPELAEECQRILTLKDGRIVAERKGSGVRGTA